MKPDIVLRQTAANLLEMLRDQKDAAVVLDELKSVHQVLKSVPEWRQFLLAQRVTNDQKTTVNQALLAGQVREETLAVFNLITEKRLTRYLEKFIREFEKQYREKMDVKLVKIFSSAETDTAVLDQLRSSVEKILSGHIQWSDETDPSIIGGIRIQVDNQVYDATVNHQLDVMRRLLESN